MISKKRLKEIAEKSIQEALNETNADESTKMAIGFIAWNSIDEAYKIGYINAKKKFAKYTEGEKNE